MSDKSSVSNWGNYPRIEGKEHLVNSYEELASLLKSSEKLITRGNGRSYGDASLAQEMISLKELKNILSFDQEKGLMKAQAGILLRQIVEETIPEGYFLKVTPGTKEVSLGGAIAANIHGKNHHSKGGFSNCVESILLMDESGNKIHCSRDEHPNLFYQTIGGMGRTGVILEAEISLLKIETGYMNVQSLPYYNLTDYIKGLIEQSGSTYSVGWIDGFSKGDKLGRGILFLGEHLDRDDLKSGKNTGLNIKSKATFSIPSVFPALLFIRPLVMIFNEFYFRRNRRKGSFIQHLGSYFYPLDGIANWNRLYGKKGFVQYQFVVEKDLAEVCIRRVLEIIQSYKEAPFLSVIKLMGDDDPNIPWSFPKDGITLALDLSRGSHLDKMIAQLDEVILKHNGRVYLAKDAISRKEVFEFMPAPNPKFSSMQSERLQ